ncbi:MAG TPA: winged helix-turn-helix domain-containing protein [Rhodanobacteraceae bacterium]|nr:winged helix-turn-helix domain-containing protein [Rhodanobacteraceae bacterium]
MQEPAIYRFAECELDVRERRLQVRGQAVTLTPKVFDALVLLVEHAGHAVSNGELTAALWPNGDVDESNLAMHIQRIRDALGGDEGESRLIETLPTPGYRFIAPVQKLTQATPLPESTSVAPAIAPGATPTNDAGTNARRRDAGGETGRRRTPPAAASSSNASKPHHHLPSIRLGDQLRLLGIAVVLLALLGGEYWWSHSRNAQPAYIPDANAIAIVDFNNLSGDAKDAWLGPALAPMLATELAADGKLHALPEERVRAARTGLPAPDADGYSSKNLATLRQRLGAHYILSGGYSVSGGADAPQLRVDITVQDAGTDSIVASVTRTGAESALPALVAGLGADLRAHLGEAPASPTVLKQLAAAQPPDADAARHMGLALQALAQHAAARARDELLQAVAKAPSYAPAHLALSRAWSQLGYHANASAAVKQAAQHAAGLSRELQLQISAQQAALEGDAGKVIELRSDLVQLCPDNPEYRLRWINTLIVTARYDSAARALAQARKLPALASDPRLELATAKLASKRGDPGGAVAHARLALTQAQTRAAPGLIAEAELQLGIALGNDAKAEASLRSAIDGFNHVGDPQGEAQAWQSLGQLQGWRDQPAAARASYQHALVLYQGMHDLDGESAVYDSLSQVSWRAGDRDGTVTALKQALAIARETGDEARQARALTGLATATSDDSASDAAAGMYREAIQLDQKAGEDAQFAFAQASYADLLRMRGQFDQAEAMCKQAQATEGKLAAGERKLRADFVCTQIQLDRGDVAGADAALRTLVTRALAGKDAFDAANARSVLGQIAMGRGQWVEARAALQLALDGWAALKEKPGEATAAALLAVCAQALHDTKARDQLAAQARSMRAGINARAEVFQLDVALAELQGASGQREPSLAALDKLAADASQRQWPGLAFEARLAALRVLEHGSDHAAIRSARAALLADARHAGFGWVVQRATAAPQHASGRQTVPPEPARP